MKVVTYLCDGCGVELDYGGRGRPPCWCADCRPTRGHVAEPAEGRANLEELRASDREIIEKYRETQSIYKAADALGRSKSAIYKVLRQNGEPMRETRQRVIPRSQLDEYFTRWRDGETLEQIGARFGITRERVRQGIAYSRPRWEIQLVKRLHRARTRTRAAARDLAARIEAGTICYVCGHLSLRSANPRNGLAMCSSECTRIYIALRFHTNLEYREKFRRAAASWHISHPDRVPEWTVRQAEKVLAGEPVNSQGTWLTQNSKAWPYAIEACRRRLPIFDRLPEELQDRIRARADAA